MPSLRWSHDVEQRLVSATSLTAWARYRVPNTEVAGNAAPGWETEGYLELLLAATGIWAIGPPDAW